MPPTAPLFVHGEKTGGGDGLEVGARERGCSTNLGWTTAGCEIGSIIQEYSAAVGALPESPENTVQVEAEVLYIYRTVRNRHCRDPQIPLLH